MKADAINLLDFIRQAPQFIIPVYQRVYSWDLAQCEKLWDDIVQIGGNKNDGEVHFLGSVMYIGDGIHISSRNKQLLLIDGQQRLTTITLLLIALSQILGENEEIEGLSKLQIRDSYLKNLYEKGDRQYKLLLLRQDKDTLISLLDSGQFYLDNPSMRIEKNFVFFKENLLKKQQSGDLAIIARGIQRLGIVDISLERDRDKPQLIFESMNSAGKKLSQADLIRNYVLMDLHVDLQTQLYEKYWYAMEELFGQCAYESHFDSFIRHYLVIKLQEIPKISEVYEKFKFFHKKQVSLGNQTENILYDLFQYAKYFCNISFEQEKDKELLNVFRDFPNSLQVDPAYPCLLKLYAFYENKKLSKDDFIQSLRLIESYVFRRSVCEYSSNAFNNFFMQLTNEIEDSLNFQFLESFFLSLQDKRKFPDDYEFADKLQTKNFYHFDKNKQKYFFNKIENYQRKEKVNTKGYTIEHIMPQKLTKEWQEDLGEEYEQIHLKYLHTLGNLTYTGYNSEYSNKTFKEKLLCKEGFHSSPLRLNEYVRQCKQWNEETIIERSKLLVNEALKIWGAPTLLNTKIREKEIKRVDLKIYERYKAFQKENIKKLYQTLRLEILKLDSRIQEIPLKRYIAYKLETNFVDIVPSNYGLKLSIDLFIHEINNPRENVRDVSNIGTWGNGDIEIICATMDDIAYCMELIEQAFKKQV